MARLALYLDEHVQLAFATALKSRGVDVLTTQEAGNIGLGDIEQLVFATRNRRSLLTYNKRHFAKIHHEWMASAKSHSGILLSDHLPIGIVLRRIMKSYFSLNATDMTNRLEYLSAWK